VALSCGRKLHRMHFVHSLGPHKLHVISIVCLILGLVLVVMCGMLLKKHTSRRSVVDDEAPQSDDQSPQRSAIYKSVAFVCCGLGLLAITFAVVVLVGGHRLLHHTHFGHSVSHRTLRVISKVSLVIGAASIAASFLLFKKTTTSRALLADSVVASQSSSSKRRILIVSSIVLGCLLIAGALHATHRHIHMPVHFPWSHHHAHGMHSYNEHWTKQGSEEADEQDEREQDEDDYEADEDDESENGEDEESEEDERDEGGEGSEGEQGQQARTKNVDPVLV